jgi:hypothetical protein
MTDHGPLGLRGDLARDAIVRACALGLDERGLFEQISDRLRPRGIRDRWRVLGGELPHASRG